MMWSINGGRGGATTATIPDGSYCEQKFENIIERKSIPRYAVKYRCVEVEMNGRALSTKHIKL